MAESGEPQDHDAGSPKKMLDAVLRLSTIVLGGWGPTLRLALLLGIFVAGVVAVARASPWAGVPVLGGVGGLIAIQRRRGQG